MEPSAFSRIRYHALDGILNTAGVFSLIAGAGMAEKGEWGTAAAFGAGTLVAMAVTLWHWRRYAPVNTVEVETVRYVFVPFHKAQPRDDKGRFLKSAGV